MSLNKFHVITPFSRWENLKEFTDNTAQADSLNLIISSTQYMLGLEDVADNFTFQIVDANKLGEVDGAYCYRKVNLLLDKMSNHIQDNDLFMFLCDDDGIPENFVASVKTLFSNLPDSIDAVVVSLKRGDHIPPDGIQHGTETLIAKSENMKVGKCGWMQAIVKGRVLKKLRFNNTACADGEMMEWLAKNYNVHYQPDTFVLFNFLQPGRYAK